MRYKRAQLHAIVHMKAVQALARTVSVSVAHTQSHCQRSAPCRVVSAGTAGAPGGHRARCFRQCHCWISFLYRPASRTGLVALALALGRAFLLLLCSRSHRALSGGTQLTAWLDEAGWQGAI